MKGVNLMTGLLVLAVVASLVFTFNPGVALAHSPNVAQDPTPEDARIHKDLQARQHTGDNKILFTNLRAGDVVAVYIVEGSETPAFSSDGTPNGLFAGAQPAPMDGKPLELFLPVSGAASGPQAKVSNVFLWTEQGGWKLLDSIIPMPSSGATEVSAQ